MIANRSVETRLEEAQITVNSEKNICRKNEKQALKPKINLLISVL